MTIMRAPAFTAGLLPRDDALRHDEASVAELWSRNTSRATPLWRSRNLLRPALDDKQFGLVWLPKDHPIFEGAAEPPVLIAQIGNSGHFAIDISGRDDLVRNEAEPTEHRYPIDAGEYFHSSLDGDCRFADLRSAMCQLSALDAECASVSRALASWHRSHRFCSACGAPSLPVAAGWQRRCETCGSMHFPRTDPVVIMLITHGNSLLLGRSHQWPQRMYSLLAGYMEPGETIEQAVRRETLEEAGVSVDHVRYLSSQPWPFPTSLMIGCHGEASTTDIQVDPAELADARWVTREQLAQIFNGQSEEISPPRPGSIAHALMFDWMSGRT